MYLRENIISISYCNVIGGEGIKMCEADLRVEVAVSQERQRGPRSGVGVVDEGQDLDSLVVPFFKKNKLFLRETKLSVTLFFPSPLLFDHAVDGLCVLPVLDLKPSHAVHFEFFLLFIFVPSLCTQFVYFIRRGRNAAAAVLIPGLRREKKALPPSLSPGAE